VVHAGAEEGQAAFATQGVVSAPQDRPGGDETGDEGSGQEQAAGIEGPSREAEEAVEAAPVALADAAGDEDALGDEAPTAGQNPAGNPFHEGAEGGLGEDGVEVMQQEDEG